MVTPKHKNIHTQEVSSVSLLSFFFSFQILIFPFIPSCPRRPEYISSSTHFSLVGGLYGASCLMRPFCPFVLGVSGIWSLWIIPSVCFCLGKKGSAEKGNQAHKGRWINRHLMAPAIQVKYSTVWTHPPYHPSPSTHLPSTLHFSPSTHRNPPVLCLHAPESLTGSHPIFTSHHHIPVCFIPINNERDSDWVKINNSEPIKWGLADIPPDAFTKARQSFGGSYKRCV